MRAGAEAPATSWKGNPTVATDMFWFIRLKGMSKKKETRICLIHARDQGQTPSLSDVPLPPTALMYLNSLGPAVTAWPVQSPPADPLPAVTTHAIPGFCARAGDPF